MAGSVHELIVYGVNKSGMDMTAGFKRKIQIIAHNFASVKAFINASEKDLLSIALISDNGKKEKINLTKSELRGIIEFQKSGLLRPDLSVSENYIRLLVANFISKQVLMIDGFTLKQLNCNPILIASLQLNEPAEIMRFYAYQSISRSIVTSMGYFVQDLLIHSGEDVFDARNEDSPVSTKFDLLIKRLGRAKTWIEVKSGPNDLDKAQILHYKVAIEKIETLGEKAFIGETYGKKEDKTVTHSLYQSYLPKWEARTLIGKELWDYISGDPKYHMILIKRLKDTAKLILNEKSVVYRIELQIKKLLKELNETYKSIDDFFDSLW